MKLVKVTFKATINAKGPKNEVTLLSRMPGDTDTEVKLPEILRIEDSENPSSEDIRKLAKWVMRENKSVQNRAVRIHAGGTLIPTEQTIELNLIQYAIR